ncbi:MAG: LamG domain-containing protein [Polyangiaceae bacterium]
MTCSAPLDRRALIAALLALCAALSACTPTAKDRGPNSLERKVDDSGINKALLFDGKDDYATTGTAEFPTGHDAYTLSTWFRLDSLTGKQAFVTLRKDFDSGLGFGVSDGVVTAWRVYGDRTLVAAPTAVSVDTWHHAAYTFDGTTNRLYVDGALAASSDNTPDKRTPTSCWLGTLEGTTELLRDSLDDVHLFEVLRTAEQLASELTTPVPAAESGLVMNLTFDENQGPIVYDHSAFENDGQLGDGITPRMPKRVEARKATN